MLQKSTQIVIVFLLVGVLWLFATPPFESSDEYKHYPVVHHIQNEGELVTLDPANPGRWLQEGAQPPLYYLVMAVVTSWIDTSDLDDVFVLNKHAFVGDPNQIHNKNLLFHDPVAERFPSTGSVQAVYIARIVSLLFGAVTVWTTYKIGRLIADEKTALLASAVTAFLPMFLFTNAAVNNDALSNMLGAVGLYLLVQLWQVYVAADVGSQRPYRLIILLGVALGLGMLTKLSLAGLLFLTGVALALFSWSTRRWSILFVDGVMIFLISVGVVAPWLLRNMSVYGFDDPIGLNVFVAVQGVRDEAMTLADWRGEFGTFYRSFWGLFGAVNVAMPQLVYTVLNLLFGAGVLGWFFNEHKNEQIIKKGAWLLVGWQLILFGLLIRWTIISEAFQGRLMFPGLAGFGVLWAVGLVALDKRGKQRSLTVGVPVLMLLLSIALPFFVIRQNYAHPKPLAEVPSDARYGPIRFASEDGAIELVGVELEPDQSRVPGDPEPLRLTLYWRSAETVSNDYLSGINVLGRELEVAARVNRHPAWGAIPTSDWEPDQIWQDAYQVYLSDEATAPNRLRFKVDLFDPESESGLVATDASGAPIELLIVGEARLAESEVTVVEPSVRLSQEFAQGVVLYGYNMPRRIRAGQQLPVELTWISQQQPARDYTVFVQLLDSSGQLVGSGDAEPVLNGEYPTGLWRQGDVIVDGHMVQVSAELPPATYTIAVGLYDRETFARLPLVNGGDAVTWTIEVIE